MVPPSHQLDVLLVPAEPCPVSRGLALVARLRAERVIDPEGRPGPEAHRWAGGSFVRLYLDDPGAVVLWSNRQGGFRVRCPVTGAPIVRAFVSAVAAWRASGPPEVRCPSCGDVHRLDAVDASPPIALGPFALVTSDAGAADLTPEAAAWAESELGPVRVVHRRG